MSQSLLSDEFKDTLSELFNIGMGRAACALSEMVNEEIILSVPQLKVTMNNSSQPLVSKPAQQRVHVVEQHFSGDLSGQAYIVFDAESSLSLVRQLLGNNISTTELGELEQETLTEVSNIILNACLCCIAEVLECDIESDVPLLMKGAVADVFQTQQASRALTPYLLTISMSFQLPNKSLRGQVSILMATQSLQKLIKELERFSLIYT